MVILKSSQEIAKLRKSNQIVAEILRELELKIEPGVSTLFLNNLAERLT
ncbi:MAG: type I methionyl aminopeptidase, partial [Deltaproteobacteria bacterium]|nr:type I methionyl aminopeptidase [Deltaproteobacteria bacterium]